MLKLYEIVNLPGYQGPKLSVQLKKSENATLPVVVVCVTKAQADDVHKLNILTKGKLSKMALGLPRIQGFLNSLEDVDVTLLARSSNRCDDDDEVEKELPQAQGSSSNITAPPIIDLVTPPNGAYSSPLLRPFLPHFLHPPVSASAAVASKSKATRKNAASGPSAPAKARTRQTNTQLQPSIQALSKTQANPAAGRRVHGGVSSSGQGSPFSTPLHLHRLSLRLHQLSFIIDSLVSISHRYYSKLRGLGDGGCFGQLRLHASPCYSAEMMLLIETALAAANNDDGFINAMALRNFPGAEAGFIWRLAHGCHAL
ncbi:hypothetical protein H1R20_g16334, partial [Candolleomyces eurysporus]